MYNGEVPEDFKDPGNNITIMDKQSFMTNDDIFDAVFVLTNAGQMAAAKDRLKQQAIGLGIKASEFEKLYKAKEQEFNCKVKSDGSNVTCFDGLAHQYNCGEWIANMQGVYKMKYTAYGQIKLLACPHPIAVTGVYNNVHDGTEKVKLEYYKRGKWHSLIVDKGTIANKAKIINLADFGVEVNSEIATNLVLYLADIVNLNIENIQQMQSTNKLGYHDTFGFVPYTADITFDGEASFKELSDSIKPVGDYQKWIRQTFDLRNNHIVNRIVTDASFASPLLDKLGALPFIVHLWGGTGTGKTVAMMSAASIWGNPDFGKLLLSLNNTHVSFEVTANFFNNLPMFCDELQLIKNQKMYRGSYDSLIMSLCSGIGRGRGAKDGGKQTMNTWRNCFVFTGEEPILSENVGGGSKNRVIEIETTEKLVEDGFSVSNFYRENYGLVGKEYIELLEEIPKEELLAKYEFYFKELKEGAEEKQALSMALILVADYVVSKHIFKQEPLKVDCVRPYMQTAQETTTYKRAYDFTIASIYKNAIRFKGTDENKGEVWGNIDADRGYCMFNRSVLEKVLKDEGFNLKAVIKKWNELGYIEVNSQGKFSHQRKVNGMTTSFVKIQLSTDASYKIADEVNEAEQEEITKIFDEK